MKRILIAIPTAKYIESETFKSIYDLIVPDGFEVDFQYFYGYQIDQIRNLIAHYTIQGGYDYLFSVDSDIILPRDSLVKMLMRKKHIITGVYRQRLPELAIEIYDRNQVRIDWKDLKGRGVVQIGGCGFGCVLIATEVLSAIGYPQFEYHSAINHNDTFSEDVDFAKKAIGKGYIMWCDSSIICGHRGEYTYTIDDVSNVEPEAVVQEATIEPKNLSDLQERYNRELNRLSNLNSLTQDHTRFLTAFASNVPNIKTIYDIGSCTLNWTKPAQQIFPNSKIICFEAMEEIRDLYNGNGWENYIAVLSDMDGKEVKFYQNPVSPNGNSYYKENFDWNNYANTLFPEDLAVMKTTRSLDSIVSENDLPLPDLIKIDVQGSELDVLKGAYNTLQTCNHVIVELQHIDLNIGAPLADEVIGFMTSIGFTKHVIIDGNKQTYDADYYFTR